MRPANKPVKSPKQDKPSPKGASQTQTRLVHRLDAYIGHHSLSAIESLLRLFRTPLQSLLTWMVIAVALALPATLYSGLQNLQAVGQRWDGISQLSVFLQPGIKEAAIENLRQEIEDDPRVDEITYISAERALQEFEKESGLGHALQSLDNNPLPPALIIRPKADASAEALGQLAQRLHNNTVVDDVVIDLAWVQRLQQILAFAEHLVLAVGALLAAGVVLVVGNTIRLAIENRRSEIVIIKLVGGTDAYVRRPFLYTGLWYGVGGGLLASLMLVLTLSWLRGPVNELAVLYQSDFTLQGLGFIGSLSLMLLAGVTGWLGAWLAVGRHLHAINPT